jgi:CHASE3 domain sensor protein
MELIERLLALENICYEEDSDAILEAIDEIARLRQQVATLTEQRDALLRSADYWKAEHLAGNEVIKKLTEQRDMAVEALIATDNADTLMEKLDAFDLRKEALAAIQSSEVTG